jgi:hypothetical protein
MTSLVFMLMMQFVVSTKAGMVNHVQGDVSLKASESAVAGVPIATGPGGYAEILLNPGSFLRLGENSQAVIENVELDNIVVRTISGASIIEVTEIDDEFPITVTSGNLTVEILQSGLYKFEGGRASILSGKLRTKEFSIVYKKGWTLLSPVGGLRAVKLAKNESSSALDAWSKNRSSLIANANIQSFPSFRNDRAGLIGRSWIWVPGFGAWTFLPGSRISSPYGYRYHGYNEMWANESNRFNVPSEESPSARTASPPSQPQSSSNTSSGNSPSGNTTSSREYVNPKNDVVPIPVP